MANVAHSTLTGSNLHESKGIASAAAGTVYVANGAGSGSFVAHSTFSGAFGNAFLWAREQQAANSASAYSGAASTWNPLLLNNTTFNSISGASVAGNAVSLPAGTYIAMGFVGVTGTSATCKMRLRNTTAGTTLIVGQVTVWDNLNQPTAGFLRVMGIFALGATSNVTMEIFHNSGNTVPKSSTGLSDGEISTFNDLYIWKIA
jgi:hypothetical protein